MARTPFSNRRLPWIVAFSIQLAAKNQASHMSMCAVIHVAPGDKTLLTKTSFAGRYAFVESFVLRRGNFCPYTPRPQKVGAVSYRAMKLSCINARGHGRRYRLDARHRWERCV